MQINSKFPVLSSLSKFMSIAGKVLMVGALILFVYTIVEANLPDHYFGPTSITMSIISSVAMVLGFTSQLMAELVGVIFAIELNTRKAE